jgi:hypothetical protein
MTHFSDLEHPDLEPFEPTLRRLIGTAFDPPRLFPKSAVLAARWAPGDRRRRFIVETLAAYSEVQRAVAAGVISMEKEARALTARLKAARQARDDTSATVLERKVETIRRRQLILRRMMDAIVYIVWGQYVVFIRRLALDDTPRAIDPDILTPIVEQAARLSEQDPYTLYLASDLTTAVQLGDLVEVSVDAHLRWRIRIVEVKEGKVNRILAERLAAGDSPEHLRETMGEKAAKQAQRMLRQKRRLKGFSNIVHAGQGIDPRTERLLRRTPDGPPTSGYQQELRMLIEKAARAGQPLITIDDCLTLAAVRTDIVPEPDRVSAAHALFHYAHPAVSCLLSTARAAEELDLLCKEPPVIDLVEHTYQATWGVPVFAWGTLDQVCDLLMGRIGVYAKFDAPAFMKRGARLGMRMEWVTGRRAEMLKQSGGTASIPGSPGASAILVELPDGTRFELLSGMLAKIFLELAKPDTVLKALLRVGPDVRKAQEEAKSSDP